MAFDYNAHLIPLMRGQAVSRGWTAATGYQPMGVTWHWTVTRDLATCRRILGGGNALRKGSASAHFGVGRSFDEGVDIYVDLENRSWHAGINQTLRWDGRPSTNSTKGSRATIGIETVHMGFARPGNPAGDGWIPVANVTGRQVLLVEPWPEEQIVMMIDVGRRIIERWPHIGERDHHGHHDICPGYKDDVLGFPFARVLSGIYGRDVPDVWTPLLLPAQRQRALRLLGYDLGTSGPARDGVDGFWGRISDAALMAFQRDHGMVQDGCWNTFVNWAMYDALSNRGIDLETATSDLGLAA